MAAEPSPALDDAIVLHAPIRVDALGAAQLASLLADFHARAAAIALAVAERGPAAHTRAIALVSAVSPALRLSALVAGSR